MNSIKSHSKVIAQNNEVDACTHILGALAEDGFAILCASYEIGFSLHKATNMPVLVAPNNQSMAAVFRSFQRSYRNTLIAMTHYVDNSHIQEYDDEAITFEMVVCGQLADPKFDALALARCEELGIKNPVNWHELFAAVGVEGVRKQLADVIR